MNKNLSEATAHNIRMKAFLYWELWEEFLLCLQRVHELYAMAMLELPRGCHYWNDERMKFMVNGTDSTVHEFDGCMYGLKSQFKDAGTAIKKPWRIVSWGVSFSDLHTKCDGSHSHGPCAGRETRATQLYTDKIVRCIIRGIKNQMLLNNAYGRKYRKDSSVKEDQFQSQSRLCTCIIVREDDIDRDTQTLHEKHVFDLIIRRGGVKVKLGSYLRRRHAPTDPDPPLVGLLVAIAAKKLVIPTAVKGYAALKATLGLIKQKGQEDHLPKVFSTYEEARTKMCQDHDISEWMDVVKIPAPIVIALAFVMKRPHREQVTHAIHLLLTLLPKSSG